MPFTPSHAAAALPFLRTPLAPAALVAGTVAPDLPYFVPGGPDREITHSLLGAVTIDPLVAAMALASWWLVLRSPVLDLGPRPIRDRMSTRPRTGIARGRVSAGLLLILAAMLIGIATHIGWDWFTHPDGLAASWAPWRTPIGPLALDHWLQHLSSVGGLVILGIWGARWLRRTPPRDRAPFSPAAVRPAVAIVLVALWTLLALGVWITGIVAGRAPLEPSLVFLVARVSFGGLGAAVLLICLAWWVVRRRR